MNAISSKIFMRVMAIIAFVLVAATSSFAQGLPRGSANSSTGAYNPLGQSSGAGAMNMRLPLILGGSFGIGSGAGVGDGHDVGICQIKPMLGAWIPGIAFVRLGYGFSSYEEKDSDNHKNEVETPTRGLGLAANRA